MKDFVRRQMALQLLNEDPPAGGAAGGDPAGGATPPADPPPADPPAGGKPEGDKKPFATFPDEKSFMARIKREAQNMQEDFIKSLGVDSADSLKALLKAEQDRKDAELSEAEKLQKQLQSLESERDKATARAETIARNTEAKLLAAELGVNPTRINHFLKLADLNDVKVYKDGTVDTDTIKERLGGLLKELPEFKGTPAAPQGGGDFGGSNNPKPALTKEQIKTMSTEEIAANIEEVRKVMGTK